MLDDLHGRYTQYLRVHGKLTLMRLADGVHYTGAAGDLIAAQVLTQLRARLPLRGEPRHRPRRSPSARARR